MPGLSKRAGAIRPELLALTFLVLVFFAPVLFTGRIMLLGDLCCLFYPGYVCYRESLSQGALPLWTPYVGCGEPFLADPERGVFYPPNLIYLFVPTSPATVISASFHVLLAGLGAYALARVWKVSTTGSMLAGVSYAFGSYTISKLAYPSQLGSSAWLPVVLATYSLWLQRRGRRLLLLMSVVICLQFLAGYPEVVTFTVGSLFLYAVFVGVSRWRARGTWTAVLVPFYGLAVAGVLALLLSMAQLLPTLEALRLSVRQGAANPHLERGSVHPLALFTLLVPSVYGTDGGWGVTYWAPSCLHYCIGAFYVGVVPVAVFVAVAVVRASAGRRQPETGPDLDDVARVRVPFLLVWAALFFAYAMGRYTPFYDWMSQLVPLLRKFVWPGKGLVCVALPLSCLAGIGLDYLSLDARRSARIAQGLRSLLFRWGTFVVFALVAGFIAVCLLNDARWGKALLTRCFNLGAVPQSSASIPWDVLLSDSLKLPIVGLIAAALLYLYARQGRARAVASWSLILLSFVDLLITNSYLLRPGPASILEGKSCFLDRFQPPGKMVRFLGRECFVQAEEYAVMKSLPKGKVLEELRPAEVIRRYPDHRELQHRLVRDMLYLAWPMADKAFGAGSSHVFRCVDVAKVLQMLMIPNAQRERVLAMLNCDRIVYAPEMKAKIFEGTLPDSVGLAILDEPMPRAYVVGGMLLCPDLKTVRQLLGFHRFDPWTLALIDRPSALGDTFADLRPGRVEHQVKRIDYGQNTLELTVESASAGVLVVSDAHYPGWRATVNGKDAPIYKVNGAFRGVRVPAGESVVRMVYRPRSLTIGLIVSLAAVAVVAVLLIRVPRVGAPRDGP